MLYKRYQNSFINWTFIKLSRSLRLTWMVTSKKVLALLYSNTCDKNVRSYLLLPQIYDLEKCTTWFIVKQFFVVSPTNDHCSPLEFSVAQWLERPTSVRKVMGSSPICELRIVFWVHSLHTSSHYYLILRKYILFSFFVNWCKTDPLGLATAIC